MTDQTVPGICADDSGVLQTIPSCLLTSGLFAVTFGGPEALFKVCQIADIPEIFPANVSILTGVLSTLVPDRGFRKVQASISDMETLPMTT